ncbi:MAG TPA: hypothetical protein P5079_09050 [Elusimicrobiota bacterium]|nr:hypothetical protein [Elusimicrobiota bacterium]
MKPNERFNADIDGFEILRFNEKNYGLKFRLKGKKGGTGLVRLSKDELALLVFTALHDILDIGVAPRFVKGK